jgi:dienelactone hydrolase
MSLNLTMASSRHHGWAAARANLEDSENKKAYEDIYARLASFFEKNNQ